VNDHETPDAFPDTADRVRRTLAAVATATPVVDREGELLAALDARDRRSGPDRAIDATVDPDELEVDLDLPPVDELAARRASRKRGRWLLAAAAAVVAVALVGVAVVRGGSDDGTGVIAEPGPVDTGWFLPAEGWTVTSVRTDWLDRETSGGTCPCATWVAARPADGALVILTEVTAPVGEGDDGIGLIDPYLVDERRPDPIDVGGRAGRTVEGSFGPGAPLTLVDAGAVGPDGAVGHFALVRGRGVELDDLVATLDAWLDAREAGDAPAPEALPLPDGFVRTPVRTADGTFGHAVVVRAREDATGREVEHRMSPAGIWDTDLLLSADVVAADDGTVTAVLGERDAVTAIRVGGDADVVVGDPFFGDEIDELDSEAARAHLDGLREVPTAGWRAAVEGAGDVDPDVLSGPSLYEAPLSDG